MGQHYVKIGNLIYSPPRNRMGKGDVGIRSVEYAIANNDHDVLEEVHRNLKAGRRWPPFMDEDDDYERYRNVFKLTRDPIILFLCACKIMGREDLMDIKFPWDVWRPHVSAWRWYLVTGKGKWLYEILELINLQMEHKIFSYHLCAFRTFITGTDKIKNRMNELFPPTHWNTLIKVLILQDENWLDDYKYEAEIFLEREVYTWSKEHPTEGGIIDQNGILVAKELLWWAINNIISYLYSAKRN